MSKIKIDSFLFGGEPHFPSELDEDGSFQSAWNEFYNSSEFNEVINQLKGQHFPLRALGITQFGPENFMYWVGLELPSDKFEIPEKWMKLELPAGTAYEEKRLDLGWRELPVEFSINLVYNAADKEQAKLPTNISYTDKPYFVERIKLNEDLSEPKEHQYFIYEGIEEEPLED
ncbi:hypothetical protein [Xylocopilactobacillus apis]|uniref:GyrI-like small molecule binding domain-containing protein n=1 Tax=Xylocopilactobacillus apis TaxID=2932183 RepID=A0AAU9CTH6_9LACO|nr:hypothetical protein [Xylocopilactobacillus apis]BDR57314.1 hypothetical protein KIMC2_18760 [Xylocopilactobacillus apis]